MNKTRAGVKQQPSYGLLLKYNTQMTNQQY